jgi:hypothetical protein
MFFVCISKRKELFKMSKNVIFIGSINMDMKHTVDEFPEEGTNENTNEILET